MNSYEEKQQRKLERYQELSKKAEKESVSRYERANKLGDAIPFGQPILVGHHSERMHRRLIEKIHNNQNKSVELSKKAEYYADKVDSILNSNVISSDDPDAVQKLKLKLEGLIKEREYTKSVEHQAYQLSNLSQNVRTVKLRIQHLEKIKSRVDKEEVINDIVIKENVEDNRVQIFFKDIPKEELRSKLKHNGFHWSPYNKCWQRQLNDWAVRIAQDIVKGVA